jgi:hypothetical protein
LAQVQVVNFFGIRIQFKLLGLGDLALKLLGKK